MLKCMVKVMGQSSSRINWNIFKITPHYTFLTVSLSLRHKMSTFLKFLVHLYKEVKWFIAQKNYTHTIIISKSINKDWLLAYVFMKVKIMLPKYISIYISFAYYLSNRLVALLLVLKRKRKIKKQNNVHLLILIFDTFLVFFKKI